MGTLLAITRLRKKDVLDVIRDATRTGLEAARIADFLASVDWSGAQARNLRIIPTLGQLEQWTSQLAEGALSQGEYLSRLLSLLPPDERTRRAYLGGGQITITRSVVDQPVRVRLDQSAAPPQTGSRTTGPLLVNESRSDSLLAV
jgi:hypothetical protein